MFNFKLIHCSFRYQESNLIQFCICQTQQLATGSKAADRKTEFLGNPGLIIISSVLNSRFQTVSPGQKEQPMFWFLLKYHSFSAQSIGWWTAFDRFYCTNINSWYYINIIWQISILGKSDKRKYQCYHDISQNFNATHVIKFVKFSHFDVYLSFSDILYFIKIGFVVSHV